MKTLEALLVLFLLGLGSLSGQPAGRQGGDDISAALVLTGPLPILTGGSTEGYSDDYDEVCPYEGSTAPDVVYSYTPVSTVTVDIDLCGSEFDTKLYVYENTVTPGLPFDCSDDFYLDDSCGIYVSKIEEAILTGGNTYYIVIDGYDNSSYGNYSMTISENNPPPPCTWGEDFLCPAAATSEGETCGNNSNGGCTMPPDTRNWESIPDSGAVFCGTLWAEGGSRDTDQYELVLAEASYVILTADANCPVHFGLLSGGTGGYGGNPDCDYITGITPGAFAGPCDPGTLDLGFLAPGTYWYSISMVADNGFPCNNHYWIEFNILPMTCPPPVDLTVDSITSTSASLGWTESGDATAWEYQVGLSGFTPADTGTSTVLNPKTVTGLAANTQYEFYVRSDCGSIFSEWEGPFVFTTSCDIILSVPWSQGFESSWPPACWSDPETTAYGWDAGTYGSAHSGSGWAYCNLAGSMLTTPPFSLSVPSVLEFWYRVENVNFPQSFSVIIGEDSVYHVDSATNETYKPVFVPLQDYTGQTVTASFVGETGAGALDFGTCLDDIAVKGYKVWTGLVSTAWNHAVNWSTGAVPGQPDPVLVPSVPAGNRFPEVSGGIPAVCDFIYLSPGASIKVMAGNTLEIRNP